MSEATTEAATTEAAAAFIPVTPVADGAGGEVGSATWRDDLPDTLRDNPEIQRTESVEALAKRFLDTKQMVGNSLRMPTNEAGQESIDAFTTKILANETLGLMKRPDASNEEVMGAVYDSLGRPANAEGYAVVEGADLLSYKAMAAEAHRLGLSKAQFEGLASSQIAMATEQTVALQAEQKAGNDALRQEWGPAYDEKIGRAATMLDLTKAPKDLIDAVASGDIGANVLRWVDQLATSLGIEGAPMAQDLTEITMDTTDGLKQKRDEITQRMLNETLSHQQTKELQAKLVRLSEQIMKAEGRE